MRLLLFQIYAPLVSWGEIAVGGERQSSRYPSKSAIIGLVSASLGIKRDEEDRLNSLSNNLGVAVQLYSGGSILKDFHTVQVPKKENKIVYHTRRAELSAAKDKIGTILSRREYRCDSLSVVAIYLKEGEIEFSLEQIEKALGEPYFHIYFGRKSCVPSLPLSPIIVVKPNLKEAFSDYEVKFPLPISENTPEWLQSIYSDYPQKNLFESSVSYFWEDGIESGLNPLQSVERYDQPLSRKRWQFTARKEYMAVEKKLEAADVHQ
ncbi:MAG: type I-E CRISPR-associated protein Cas5/CasD [Spirochaetia bacterium]|jgi:CRISPR system Cascade subunit CasD|nr:type I-E CRISPR-associated protein Cas5/CasD [Spirochaetia bacterium]